MKKSKFSRAFILTIFLLIWRFGFGLAQTMESEPDPPPPLPVCYVVNVSGSNGQDSDGFTTGSSNLTYYWAHYGKYDRINDDKNATSDFCDNTWTIWSSFWVQDLPLGQNRDYSASGEVTYQANTDYTITLAVCAQSDGARFYRNYGSVSNY